MSADSLFYEVISKSKTRTEESERVRHKRKKTKVRMCCQGYCYTQGDPSLLLFVWLGFGRVWLFFVCLFVCFLVLVLV